MLEYRGKTATISEVKLNGYRLEEFDFTWNDSMLEDDTEVYIINEEFDKYIKENNLELELRLIELSLKYRTTVTDVYQRYEYFKKKLEKNPTI